MPELYEYKHNTPIAEESYDVAVIGGGSAGICAAIAAAREGAKTLLIEDTGWLGGIGSTCAMVEFGPVYRAGLRVVGGVPQELMERMIAFGGAVRLGEEGSTMFAPETFAHVAMEMCLEAGVKLMLHSRFIDCILEGERISGILVDTKGGMFAIRSKVFLDSTGDGDVFFRAGLPFKMGRDADGAMQPMTLVFFVNNVNYAVYEAAVQRETGGKMIPFFEKLVAKAKADGNFHVPISRPGSVGVVPRYGRIHDPESCEVFVNSTNVVGKCGADAKDLTEAEIITRRQVYELYAFLKDYVPGFADCYLSHVPNAIGVRETRRLTGRYVLTAKDMVTGKRFCDTVAVGFNTIDVHQVAGEDFDLTDFAPGEYYSVPYRCLVTNELSNLIVTGRCISVDHEALGAVRVMVNTMPIAEGAGTAAAIAAKLSCDVRDVPVDMLQETLVKNGAVIGF